MHILKSLLKLIQNHLEESALDVFKMVFDVVHSEVSVDEWVKREKTRQQDKTINNRIGEFHQKLLGKVDGWTNLGIGHESHVDLKE